MEVDKCDQCSVLEGRLELAKIKTEQLVLEKEALNLELREFNFSKFDTPNVEIDRQSEDSPSAEVLQPGQTDSPQEDLDGVNGVDLNAKQDQESKNE